MMKVIGRFVWIGLYGLIGFGANGAWADFDGLKVLDVPQVIEGGAFESFDGEAMRLGPGVQVVNFWATWCAPCRHEMPSLDRLQGIFADRTVEVVTIATGRNDPLAMQRFFEEAGIEHLPLYRDPKFALARELGVQGLPYTVILDAEGAIVARFRGDTEWDSPEAVAYLRTLSKQDGIEAANE